MPTYIDYLSVCLYLLSICVSVYLYLLSLWLAACINCLTIYVSAYHYWPPVLTLGYVPHSTSSWHKVWLESLQATAVRTPLQLPFLAVGPLPSHDRFGFANTTNSQFFRVICPDIPNRPASIRPILHHYRLKKLFTASSSPLTVPTPPRPCHDTKCILIPFETWINFRLLKSELVLTDKFKWQCPLLSTYQSTL